MHTYTERSCWHGILLLFYYYSLYYHEPSTTRVIRIYRKRIRVIFTRVSDRSPTLAFVAAAAAAVVGGEAVLATFGASGDFEVIEMVLLLLFGTNKDQIVL